MAGLLYKDLYLVRKNILLGLVSIAGGVLLAVIFILGMNVGNFQEMKELGNVYNLFFKSTIFGVCLAGICVALTSSSAIDQDHKAEWYKVLYASPINIWQEILSRYILAFVVNTIMCAWAGVLLPFVYMAGETTFGFAEFKAVIYCWLAGLIVIMIRLPIDIIFPAKISVGISCTILGLIVIALTAWIMLEEETEKIIKTVVGWMSWVYDHGVLIVIAVVIASFSFSYFGKRNRRWA